MWYVIIEASKKNFSPKVHLLHFCKDDFSLKNQKTVFWLKAFLQYKKQ